VQQLRNACRLPVAVAGALMPDAHVGYGLPIGGVLATDNAVIPYAVGVDIACRMKLSVLDLPVGALDQRAGAAGRAIERETRFGVGAEFKARREHDVMDADWRVTPVTAGLKDRAWAQLGTSGSGNHFVEFGGSRLRCRRRAAAGRVPRAAQPLGQPRRRRAGGPALQQAGAAAAPGAAAGTGAPGLARPLHRAGAGVLGGHGADGALRRGQPRADSRARRARALGVEGMLDLENHHNFAWRERHRLPDGSEAEVIVHRKGATPAGLGRARDHPWLDGRTRATSCAAGAWTRRCTRRRTAPAVA
jgi:tRNA-splicing ligase RtcB (3'-phosphate/5'-hydroxy nucleic acid ligase)